MFRFFRWVGRKIYSFFSYFANWGASTEETVAPEIETAEASVSELSTTSTLEPEISDAMLKTLNHLSKLLKQPTYKELTIKLSRLYLYVHFWQRLQTKKQDLDKIVTTLSENDAEQSLGFSMKLEKINLQIASTQDALIKNKLPKVIHSLENSNVDIKNLEPIQFFIEKVKSVIDNPSRETNTESFQTLFASIMKEILQLFNAKVTTEDIDSMSENEGLALVDPSPNIKGNEVSEDECEADLLDSMTEQSEEADPLLEPQFNMIFKLLEDVKNNSEQIKNKQKKLDILQPLLPEVENHSNLTTHSFSDPLLQSTVQSRQEKLKPLHSALYKNINAIKTCLKTIKNSIPLNIDNQHLIVQKVDELINNTELFLVTSPMPEKFEKQLKAIITALNTEATNENVASNQPLFSPSPSPTRKLFSFLEPLSKSDSVKLHSIINRLNHLLDGMTNEYALIQEKEKNVAIFHDKLAVTTVSSHLAHKEAKLLQRKRNFITNALEVKDNLVELQGITSDSLTQKKQDINIIIENLKVLQKKLQRLEQSSSSDNNAYNTIYNTAASLMMENLSVHDPVVAHNDDSIDHTRNLGSVA